MQRKKPLLWFPFALIIIFASLSILVLTQSHGKAEYYGHGHEEDEQLAKSQESSSGQESSNHVIPTKSHNGFFAPGTTLQKGSVGHEGTEGSPTGRCRNSGKRD